MAYSEKLIDHFEHPRNVGTLDKNAQDVGTGMVGAPACGDVMRLQIKVNPEGVIEDAKFKTYGCGSAIASSSLVSEWVKGKTLEEAGKITNAQIADELALPPVKIHCSILAEDAVKAAIADYRAKQHPAEQDAKKEYSSCPLRLLKPLPSTCKSIWPAEAKALACAWASKPPAVPAWLISSSLLIRSNPTIKFGKVSA